MPVNTYNNTGSTMPSPPSAYAPPVSTPVRITSPPSRSNGGDKPAAEDNSSETVKEEDGPEKSEVQDDDPSPVDTSGKQDSSDKAA